MTSVAEKASGGGGGEGERLLDERVVEGWLACFSPVKWWGRIEMGRDVVGLYFRQKCQQRDGPNDF